MMRFSYISGLFDKHIIDGKLLVALLRSKRSKRKKKHQAIPWNIFEKAFLCLITYIPKICTEKLKVLSSHCVFADRICVIYYHQFFLSRFISCSFKKNQNSSCVWDVQNCIWHDVKSDCWLRVKAIRRQRERSHECNTMAHCLTNDQTVIHWKPYIIQF